MSMSREIDKKMCQIYTKIRIYQIWYKNSSIKQIKFSKYATNPKKTISQRFAPIIILKVYLKDERLFLTFIDVKIV